MLIWLITTGQGDVPVDVISCGAWHYGGWCFLQYAGSLHVSSEMMKTSATANGQSASGGWRDESELAALWGFCLLKSLLTSLSTLMGVVIVVGEFRATVVGSCEMSRPLLCRGGAAGAGGRCYGGW